MPTKAQTNASLNFDGVNDLVETPGFTNFVNGTSYTKEVWIRIPEVAAGTRNIISENNSALFIDDNGYLTAGHNSSGYNNVKDPNVLTANVWYHVAVTYNSNTGDMALYKNGVQVSTATGVAPFTSSTPTRLGSIYTGTDGYFFKGDMDEVRIWSVARTPVEIEVDQQCSLAEADTVGLKAYYDFNQGTPDGDNTTITTLIDNSDNSNDGTLQNFALTGITSNFVSQTPSICSVVPVELTFFTGKENGNSVNLSWQTASEMNNAGFDIERSSTGNSDWEKIGFVAGSGTSSEVHNYSFNDLSPLAGKNYYRLNQKDLDGKSKISEVVAVVSNNLARVSLYPTVTHSMITLSVPDNSLLNTEYAIFDNEGKVIRKSLITSIRQTVDVSNLQNGMYFLKVQNGKALKFIKQ